MKIRVFDAVEAEGEPDDLALYTFVLMSSFKLQKDLEEEEEAKKEAEAIIRAFSRGYEEMVRSEMTFGDVMEKEQNKQERDEKE